jgi:hypothetical protein
VAAHPGYTETNLVDNGMNRGRRTIDGSIGIAVTALVGQSVAQGATPQIRAAVEPGLAGGTYVGPQGPFEMHGAPGYVTPPKPARDPALASALWELSENATGVRFP